MRIFYKNGYSSQSDFIYPCHPPLLPSVDGVISESPLVLNTTSNFVQSTSKQPWQSCDWAESMSRPLIKHNEYKQYVTLVKSLEEISKMIYVEVYARVVEVDTRQKSNVRNDEFIDELGSSSRWQRIARWQGMSSYFNQNDSRKQAVRLELRMNAGFFPNI